MMPAKQQFWKDACYRAFSGLIDAGEIMALSVIRFSVTVASSGTQE
jgi:hypothetical protein